MRTFRKIFFLILINPMIYYCCVSFAQESVKKQEVSRAKNNINASLLGGASYFSVNYERLFLITPGSFVSISAGVGTAKEYDNSFLFEFPERQRPTRKYFTMPHHVTFNIGGKKNYFELGFGGTWILTKNMLEKYLAYPVFGYRLHPADTDKINFRVFLNFPPAQTISDSFYDVGMFEPIGGISAGLNF